MVGCVTKRLWFWLLQSVPKYQNVHCLIYWILTSWVAGKSSFTWLWFSPIWSISWFWVIFSFKYSVSPILWSSIPTHLSVSTHPVDDLRLKGADDAAVVEDWMLLVQFFKGCGRLGGEERHMVTVGHSSVCRVCKQLVATSSCVLCRHTVVGPQLKNVIAWNNNYSSVLTVYQRSLMKASVQHFNVHYWCDVSVCTNCYTQ